MAEKRTIGQAMVDTNHYRVNLRFSSNIPTKNRGRVCGRKAGASGKYVVPGPLIFIISSHVVSYVHRFVTEYVV